MEVVVLLLVLIIFELLIIIGLVITKKICSPSIPDNQQTNQDLSRATSDLGGSASALQEKIK